MSYVTSTWKDALMCNWSSFLQGNLRLTYIDFDSWCWNEAKCNASTVATPQKNTSVAQFDNIMHRRLFRVNNMLAMCLIYHKPGLTPTTSVTSTAISPVKMSIGHKSPTDLHSEMIFLQGKPVFYTFLPSTSPLLTDNLPILLKFTPPGLQKRKWVTWYFSAFR